MARSVVGADVLGRVEGDAVVLTVANTVGALDYAVSAGTTPEADDDAHASRAEGGAGTSRADTPRINPAELFRSEIARPQGGAFLVQCPPRRAACPC